MTQVPIFIVSSGRAGSTLIARMIRSHPRLLCVSDLFEPIGPEPYFDPERSVDGGELFTILSRPSLPQRIAFWRRKPTAELLYLPKDDRRVSLLLTYTLPFLTQGNPEDLFGELRQAMSDWPPAPMADQLVRFFDWLRDRFDRELWVERTGGSLQHMGAILETWPDARVVHSYRDPRETSISMMTGSFFRLYLELSKNPRLGEWDWSYTPPIEEMGEMLDGWVVDAARALGRHPAELQMDLAYERLLDEPEETLLSLSRFILQRPSDDEDRVWAATQAKRIRRPPLRFPSLSSPDQDRLQRACERSLRLLGYREIGQAPRR